VGARRGGSEQQAVVEEVRGAVVEPALDPVEPSVAAQDLAVREDPAADDRDGVLTLPVVRTQAVAYDAFGGPHEEQGEQVREVAARHREVVLTVDGAERVEPGGPLQQPSSPRFSPASFGEICTSNRLRRTTPTQEVARTRTLLARPSMAKRGASRSMRAASAGSRPRPGNSRVCHSTRDSGVAGITPGRPVPPPRPRTGPAPRPERPGRSGRHR